MGLSSENFEKKNYLDEKGVGVWALDGSRGTGRRGVKCVLQKCSLFREKIHGFAISPFRETFCFTCFAKIRDEKQTKRSRNGHPFRMLCDTETQPSRQKPLFVA